MPKTNFFAQRYFFHLQFIMQNRFMLNIVSNNNNFEEIPSNFLIAIIVSQINFVKKQQLKLYFKKYNQIINNS